MDTVPLLVRPPDPRRARRLVEAGVPLTLLLDLCGRVPSEDVLRHEGGRVRGLPAA